MEMVNIKINGMPLSVPSGISILEAARYAGIEIPTLCFLKEINQIGACRICMVEVKGARSLVASCVYPVAEGLEVWTNTPKVRQSRQTTLELLLSEHQLKVRHEPEESAGLSGPPLSGGGGHSPWPA